MPNFSGLVEMLYSCHCMQLCALFGTRVSTQTDWKRGLVVPLWKGKGDRQVCNNCRGLTLLSVPSKVFARTILNEVRHHLLEQKHPRAVRLYTKEVND